jgi:TPR repeat protein
MNNSTLVSTVNFTEYTQLPENRDELFELCSGHAHVNNSIAQNNLGFLHETRKEPDYETAYNMYKKSIESQNSFAMVNLGNMFNKGLGRDENHKKAMFWYRKSAELQNSFGMYELALMHQRLEEWSKAIELYTKSASYGNSNAMVNLGLLYQQGNGVDKSESTAIGWYEQAISLGNAYAMNIMALLYKDGSDTTPVNLNKAYELFTRSINHGNENAIQNLGELYMKSKDQRIVNDLMMYYEKYPSVKTQFEFLLMMHPEAFISIATDTIYELWKLVNSKKLRID